MDYAGYRERGPCLQSTCIQRGQKSGYSQAVLRCGCQDTISKTKSSMKEKGETGIFNICKKSLKWHIPACFLALGGMVVALAGFGRVDCGVRLWCPTSATWGTILTIAVHEQYQSPLRKNRSINHNTSRCVNQFSSHIPLPLVLLGRIHCYWKSAGSIC